MCFLVIMKDIFKRYNNTASLLVISGYPKRKELYSKGVCAVSSFAKNTLTSLQKENPDRKIVVLTMVFDKYESYEEDNMLIIRCFRRNSPISFINLFYNVLKFNKVKDVLIEFEFASFGDTFTTGLLAPFVWLLKLFGKNINLVIHQVLEDIKNLSGHIGIEFKSPKIKILNFGLKLFYILLCLPSSKIFVLEQEFKNKLSKFTSSDKIIVVPHGIDQNIKKISTKIARKNMGIKENEFVLLYFGYLTWYKGIDFLVKALSGVGNINGKKIRLIVAGGPSFTQEEKNHYLRFLEKVNRLLKSKASKNMIATGFVLEKDIPQIFQASDLAIFPYRIFMSSSGPLSLAISYNKPFILSENLAGLTSSSDIQKAMEIAKMKKEEIVFKLNKKSLIKTIKNCMNPQMNKKMVRLSKILNNERSFANLGKKYSKVLFDKNNLNNDKKIAISFPLTKNARSSMAGQTAN